MSSRTANRVSTLRKNGDGAFTVVLSHLNRPNRHGEIILPLSEAQLQELNARGGVRGRMGQPTRPSMAGAHLIQHLKEIEPENVAFTLHRITAREIPHAQGQNGRVQEITAELRLEGLYRSFTESIFKDPQAVLYFGLCAYTTSRPEQPGVLEVIHPIGWNLIASDPYPEESLDRLPESLIRN